MSIFEEMENAFGRGVERRFLYHFPVLWLKYAAATLETKLQKFEFWNYFSLATLVEILSEAALCGVSLRTQ